MDFVSWKDRKGLATALKEVYRAPAEQALSAFEAGPWGTRYPAIGQSWRPAWADRPHTKFLTGSFKGRMRDELLKEKLFFTIRQARSILARWVDDYNTEQPHSSLGYLTPTAFAAKLEQQRAELTPPVALPALMRDNTDRSLVAAG